MKKPEPTAADKLVAAIRRDMEAIGADLDEMTGVLHPSDLKDKVSKIRATCQRLQAAANDAEGGQTSGPGAPEQGEPEGGQTSGPGAPEPSEGGQTSGPGAPSHASGHLPEGFPGLASLEAAGEATFAKVRARVAAGTLEDIDGIGESTAAKIAAALEEAGG